MQPSSTTRVPALVAALAAAAQSALPTLKVITGPLVAVPPNDYLLVAVSTRPGEPAVRARQDLEAGGLTPRPVETITVHCLASTWAGSQDLNARLTRLGQILAALDLALRADPDLGGVVDQVGIGEDLEWWTGQNPDGAIAEVDFDVTAQAWL